MKIRDLILYAFSWALTLYPAPAPTGAKFDIQFTFRDNNNELRNKPSGCGSLCYSVAEDGYHETVWIEGPFDAAVPCQIVNYERTDASIKLVKTLSYYANGNNYNLTAKFPNTWVQPDYATPDFLAALIKAGRYYYCPDMSALPHSQTCSQASAIKGTFTAQRQNRLIGGLYKPTGYGRTEVAQTWAGSSGTAYSKNGDVTKLVDGVTSATRYPALGTGAVSLSWDLRDLNGTRIEKGYYVVWVQMSAERIPVEMEEGTVVNGKEAVHLETCWNDPAYNNIGHHRVVEMFYLGDSAFTKTVYQEKKWSGDAFNYLGSGGMTFTYTATSSIQNLKPRASQSAPSLFPNPVARNGRLSLRFSDGREPRNLSGLGLYALNGNLAKPLSISGNGEVVLNGLDGRGRPLAPGLYLLRASSGPLVFARPVMIGF